MKTLRPALALVVGILLLIVGQNFTYSPNVVSLDISPNTFAGSFTRGLVPDDVNDFLIQDVCVDDDDRVLAQDPLNCKKTRNLRVGEDMPYSKVSRRIRDDLVVSYQNSFPVWANGFQRIVRSMNHEGSQNSGRDYNVGDGYDVIERQGAYASIMGTRDPVTIDENHVWYGSNCRKEDGWMLFPTNILSKLALGEEGNEVVNVKGYGTGETCNSGTMNKSYTRYARVMASYRGGQQLETLRTYHFAQSDPSLAGSFEAFYHTRLYGLTKWEAWKDVTSCVSTKQEKAGMSLAEAKAACTSAGLDCSLQGKNCATAVPAHQQATGTCSGPSSITITGGKNGPKFFLRTDCSDNSFIVLNELPIHAFSTPLTTTFALGRNLLADGDFASVLGSDKGTGAKIAVPPSKNWNSTPSVTVTPVLGDKFKFNGSIKLTGRFDGNMAVSNTAAISDWEAPAAYFNVGALINGPDYGWARVELLLFNDEGLVETRFIKVSTLGKWAPVRFYFEWPMATKPVTKVRFRFVPGTPTEGSDAYGLDEAFVAMTSK